MDTYSSQDSIPGPTITRGEGLLGRERDLGTIGLIIVYASSVVGTSALNDVLIFSICVWFGRIGEDVETFGEPVVEVGEKGEAEIEVRASGLQAVGEKGEDIDNFLGGGN